MLELFEPEEFIGRHWHRLVGGRSSLPRHPDAAVTLESIRPRLGVFFRGLGGDRGVRLAAAARASSGHRLSVLERIGLGTERLERPALDGDVLQLPAALDVFPDAALNERLYEWLAAYFAHAEAAGEPPADPLRADVWALRQAQATTARVLARWPGLARLHAELCAALLAARPKRSLPKEEAAVEAAVLALLGAGGGGAVLDASVPLDRFAAPVGYKPFLPVPLWGEVAGPAVPHGVAAAPDAAVEEGSSAPPEGDGQRRKAKRRDSDQVQRDDPLILNRFEKLFGLAEMMNIPRPVDDDDEEGARQAADDMEEIALAQHQRKPSTRLKLDLDLAPAAVDAAPLTAVLTYPEWDHRRRAYHPAHCRVVAEPASEEGEDWAPDEAALRRIRQVRRQFEALRPKRTVFTGQPDGDDLDLTALVRRCADHRAGGAGSDRVYQAARNAARDLAVAVLVDTSLSTDGWVDGRRVLDVEKEALLALSNGLNACGDPHGIFAFTSKKRDWVRVQTVKEFDEPLSARVQRRVQALKPGHYTRMGAALRHTAARLAERPNRHRLLILLSDGKPNDVDHYEGRYGIEDTRVAIQEARRQGIALFGITVDAEARDYFPYLFGRGGYAIFPQVTHLTKALPALYRQVVG
ncbi:nitric oxide reductase activation protein NorD [Roseomonas genomospecies 6]|uniref:VWA domain-containing protein n=1 Tax=Roseomonas genomospecies 6 TaxID=214106 RepID=A0A9W7NJS5_9PROT|nr:VWA domain-containing protein [Roseomonas genomospecies 6]KAA0680710.1 VWA domain-containing protein [Roseomonas genomospecies 6]